MRKANCIFWLFISAAFISVTMFFAHTCADAADLQKITDGTTIYIGMETGGDWPPYEFFQRENGTITKKVIGFNIDVLNEILSQHGLKYEFIFLPWKRCLRYLESGDKIQMILPTSLNEERKMKYLISDTAYTITPSYFYMKKKYPDGLKIIISDELTEYGKICGKFGYNYKNFGLENEIMDNGAKNFDALIKKLKKGRCNIIFARYEILAGLSLTGQPLLSDEIGSAPIPDVPGEDFHYMISKKYLHGKELLQIINNGIEKLQSQGRLNEILKKYIQ